MPALRSTGNTKAPRFPGGLHRGGRYWDRTSDLFRVREARYRCANRPEMRHPSVCGGGDGIRTRVDGFAGRCLASRPPHHRGSRLREYPNGGIPSGEKPAPEGTSTRADDEIRTRDPHLGKVMRYHCATSAEHDRSRALRRPLSRRRRELYPTPAVSPKSFPFTGRVPRVHALAAPDRSRIVGSARDVRARTARGRALAPGRDLARAAAPGAHGATRASATRGSAAPATSATIDPHASAGGDWRSW